MRAASEAALLFRVALALSLCAERAYRGSHSAAERCEGMLASASIRQEYILRSWQIRQQARLEEP